MKTRHKGDERKQFFNERADGWLDTFYGDPGTGEHTRFSAEFRRLFDLLEIGDGHDVLDVGCGSGVLVPHILERIGPGGRLYELDYAENMIAANRRLHPDRRITFINADVLDMPVESGSCDLVICFSCFPHLDNKPEAMRQMTRVLKDAGRLAIAHFNSSDELNMRHAKEHAVMHDRMPDPDELKRIFETAGLKVTHFHDQPGFFLAMGGRSSILPG